MGYKNICRCEIVCGNFTKEWGKLNECKILQFSAFDVNLYNTISKWTDTLRMQTATHTNITKKHTKLYSQKP